MVRSVAVPAQQGVARRQQQHDGSGLQRGFGEKFMEVLDEVDTWTGSRPGSVGWLSWAGRKGATRMEGSTGGLVFSQERLSGCRGTFSWDLNFCFVFKI